MNDTEVDLELLCAARTEKMNIFRVLIALFMSPLALDRSDIIEAELNNVVAQIDRANDEIDAIRTLMNEPSASQMWECSECHVDNRQGTERCHICEALPPWRCCECHVDNRQGTDRCHVCDTPPPWR